MDEAAVVRRRQSPRDVQGVRDRLARRHRLPAHARAQRLALQQLGDDVRAALMRADVVDGEDVRVAEPGGGARLLLEAREAARLADLGDRDDLHGHLAREPHVDGAIDLAHPPRAERSDDFI
jgi:hypothetical protein